MREVIYRLRWRVDKIDNKSKYQGNKETFGFRSSAPAPFQIELKELEDKLEEIVQNVEFRNVSNSFQTKLNSDIQNIEGEPKLFVKADKTTNRTPVPGSTGEKWPPTQAEIWRAK